MKYTYHPMQMHLHACHDIGGSMEGHIANAASLGMRYIRFTDHDNRIGYKEFPVNTFDFSRGELMYEDVPGKTCGFELVGEPKLEFLSDRMVISSAADACGVKLTSSAKRHTVSLLADVTLTLGLIHTNGVGRVTVDITLSQHPYIGDDGVPVHNTAHLTYALSGARGGEIPLVHSDDGIYVLHLSDDACKYGVGGLDNAFCSVSVMVMDGADCEFFKLFTERKCSAAEVQNKQRALANEIGARYGVKPFVTTEISSAGQHQCVYDERVPIIDYAAHGFSVTSEQAIAHVKKYGGIFSYNHPYDRFKRMGIADEDKCAIIASEADALAKEKVHGASLMEVGFPCGRHGFSYEEHTRLWDMIGLAGVFITGHGDSDSHINSVGWFSGNNFAAYIAAPSELQYPIDDGVFIESMKAGRVYSADPVYIKGYVNFECDGLPMGAVILTDGESRKMRFAADKTEPHFRLRTIVNGEIAHDAVVGGESVDLEFMLRADRAVNLARAELLNADGRCILMTNPIYLVRRDLYSGEIPAERLYAEERKK